MVKAPNPPAPKKQRLLAPKWKMRELYEALGGAEPILGKIRDAGYEPPGLMTIRGWAFRRSIPTKWLPVILQIALDENVLQSISQFSANKDR